MLPYRLRRSSSIFLKVLWQSSHHPDINVPVTLESATPGKCGKPSQDNSHIPNLFIKILSVVNLIQQFPWALILGSNTMSQDPPGTRLSSWHIAKLSSKLLRMFSPFLWILYWIDGICCWLKDWPAPTGSVNLGISAGYRVRSITHSVNPHFSYRGYGASFKKSRSILFNILNKPNTPIIKSISQHSKILWDSIIFWLSQWTTYQSSNHRKR